MRGPDEAFFRAREMCDLWPRPGVAHGAYGSRQLSTYA